MKCELRPHDALSYFFNSRSFGIDIIVSWPKPDLVKSLTSARSVQSTHILLRKLFDGKVATSLRDTEVCKEKLKKFGSQVSRGPFGQSCWAYRKT